MALSVYSCLQLCLGCGGCRFIRLSAQLDSTLNDPLGSTAAFITPVFLFITDRCGHAWNPRWASARRSEAPLYIGTYDDYMFLNQATFILRPASEHYSSFLHVDFVRFTTYLPPCGVIYTEVPGTWYLVRSIYYIRYSNTW